MTRHVVGRCPGRSARRGENRGVFKTTDGGRIWRKVLYKDEQSGVVDMSRDPLRPILYSPHLNRASLDARK